MRILASRALGFFLAARRLWRFHPAACCCTRPAEVIGPGAWSSRWICARGMFAAADAG